MEQLADPTEFGDFEDEGDSVSLTGPARNAQMQQQFAAEYVRNGGNGTDAATFAGYTYPNRQVFRLLSNPKVLSHIREMVRSSIEGALPIAIRALVECCGDEKASWKDRMNAAEKLLKLGDVAPQPTASPGVQVNINLADTPSAVISSVWANREGRMSGIGAGMPDTKAATFDHYDDGDGGGG